MKFRLLNANEIDVRIGTAKNLAKGISLLLYKNARVDMDILDEVVGADNWQRDHKEIKGNVYCGVSIFDKEKLQWITKWDAGAESNTEAVKGEASDSFKRACVNWGIGRELYTSPFIWITSDNFNVLDGKCYDTFEVIDIGYNANNEINKLVIINSKTKNVVFELGKKIQQSKQNKQKEPEFNRKEELDRIIEHYGIGLVVEVAKELKIASATATEEQVRQLETELFSRQVGTK